MLTCDAGVLDWALAPLVPSRLRICVAGLVYRALGFPPQFFTVLFAVPRVTGYLSHWKESLTDPDTKILRPQQDYRVSPLVKVGILLAADGPSILTEAATRVQLFLWSWMLQACPARLANLCEAYQNLRPVRLCFGSLSPPLGCSPQNLLDVHACAPSHLL